jgi:hypothetical protein
MTDKMNGWRPINSAPRDGTLIDVWCKMSEEAAEDFDGKPYGIRMTDVSWHNADECGGVFPHEGWVKVMDDGNFYLLANEEHADNFGSLCWVPTHWRSIPDGPEAP